MGDSSASLHERFEDLSAGTLDRHRAIVSLMEELEAIDWYDQRIEGTADPLLKGILAHNRDDETEHAVMTLEYLRQALPALDVQLQEYMFKPEALAEKVAAHAASQAAAIAATQAGEDGESGGDGSLGIGSLKQVEEAA